MSIAYTISLPLSEYDNSLNSIFSHALQIENNKSIINELIDREIFKQRIQNTAHNLVVKDLEQYGFYDFSLLDFVFCTQNRDEALQFKLMWSGPVKEQDMYSIKEEHSIKLKINPQGILSVRK